MVNITPIDKVFFVHTGTLINTIRQLQSENFLYLGKARNLKAGKSIVNFSFILKNKKIMTQQIYTHCHGRKRVIRPAMPVPSSSFVPACYPYPHEYSYPVTINRWSSMRPPLYPIGTVPFYLRTTTPLYSSNYRPFMRSVLQPHMSAVATQSYIPENSLNVSDYTNEFNYSAEHIDAFEENPNEESQYALEELTEPTSISSSNTDTGTDQVPDTYIEDQLDQNLSLEYYLKLPKTLFPSPRQCNFDPNPIIDEFCKLPNLHEHAPWLLDLEYGIPRDEATRPTPIYDAKLNSIHCKSDPDAVHPDFNNCNKDFKRVLLFYYDCIISSWYRGFALMNRDDSVEKFQSWLLKPMQDLGIGWP